MSAPRLPPELAEAWAHVRLFPAQSSRDVESRWRQRAREAALALSAGASAVPLGDNGGVYRRLAERLR